MEPEPSLGFELQEMRRILDDCKDRLVEVESKMGEMESGGLKEDG